MSSLPSLDLPERLFQGLLQLLGAPRPDATPALDAQAWSRAYARERQRMGSLRPLSQDLQRGMERWVTAFPEAPELAARADVDVDVEPEFEQLHAGDTVPAAFMTRELR